MKWTGVRNHHMAGQAPLVQCRLKPCLHRAMPHRLEPFTNPPSYLDYTDSLWQTWALSRIVTDIHGRISAVTDAELPEHVKSALEANLPADLDDLLDDAQRSILTADLAKLARLRREAEVESATLRMA